MNRHEEPAELERQLTSALHLLDPPTGFAERTLARLEVETIHTAPAKRAALPGKRHLRARWLGGAIAAALLAGAFLAEQVHLHQRQQEALRAQQQFEAGLRITDDVLSSVQKQIEAAGSPWITP